MMIISGEHKHKRNLTMGLQVGEWPPESPDCMPVEQAFGNLKATLRRKYKPNNKEELVNSILDYFNTVTPAMCRKWIRRSWRMMGAVGREEGASCEGKR